MTFVGLSNRPVPEGRIESHIPVHVAPRPWGRLRWEYRTLPRLLARVEPAPDLYHATWNHGVPGGLAYPSVLTLHDLIPWRFPRVVPWPWPWRLHHLLYKRAVRASARAAAAIVAVSESTRRDIARLIPDVAARVEVVPNALPRWFRPAAASPAGPREWSVAAPEPRWLYVGGFDPRKGIDTLLRAMATAFPDRATMPRLILAGARNDKTNALEALARDLGVAAEFPGYVADEALPSLYASASLFIYPSRHEGFGIPLLFAMAAGVPSIASDGGSLPEILGDAGLTFPAGDVAALAALLTRAARDPASIAALGARGRERVRGFSPDVFAQRMLRAYERAATRRAEYA